MDFETLKNHLATQHGLPIAAWYGAYHAAGHPDDPEQFLMYLLEQSLVNTELLVSIVEQLEVAVTGSNHDFADSGFAMMGILGKGAMGEVYLAKDRGLQRKVAYKRLLPTTVANRLVLARFLSEAQITAQLGHPNIVPIYALERTADGSLAYAMKLVKGKTFKELVQETKAFYAQGQIPDEEHQQATLLSYFLNACDAMAYAHSKGIIHRDLKPANIMVGPYQEVYVMDWGIARLMGTRHNEALDEEWVEIIDLDSHEPLEERTQVGQLVGTPRYMSPQQAAGRNTELDGLSDQFSMGLILYELVTLKPALTASNQNELLKKVLKAEKQPWLHLYPHVKLAPELQAIIDKATALKTGHRYTDLKAMADDVRRFMRGEAILAKPDTWVRTITRWINHHQKATLSLVLLICLSGAMTVIGSLYQRQQSALKTRQREAKLGYLLATVASKSRHLDHQFLSLQVQLQEMGAVIRKMRQVPLNSQKPIFWNTQYSFRHHQPRDLKYAIRYTKMLSWEHLVFKAAPGVAQTVQLPQAQQLSLLQPYFRQAWPSDPNTSSPINWLHVGLNNGLYVSYPGRTGFFSSYDPRETPWYRLAANRPGIFWGNPYVDPQGQGLMLSCSLALYQGAQFTGVLALDLTFDYIIRSWMALPTEAAAIESYMLNEQGKILVRSTDKRKKYGMRFGDQAVNQILDLPLFPHADLVKAIQGKQSGHFEYVQDSRPMLLVYYRMEALGWYFVTQVDLEGLLAQE